MCIPTICSSIQRRNKYSALESLRGEVSQKPAILDPAAQVYSAGQCFVCSRIPHLTSTWTSHKTGRRQIVRYQPVSKACVAPGSKAMQTSTFNEDAVNALKMGDARHHIIQQTATSAGPFATASRKESGRGTRDFKRRSCIELALTSVSDP